MEFFKKNAFLIAATGYGVYSAGKSSWNLQSGEGCAKCETTGLVLGLGLGVWGGILLIQAAQGKGGQG